MSDELEPCPFCRAGETRISESKFWTGMRNEVISVRVQHWCPRVEGQPQSVIDIAGRDRDSAIRHWNTRAHGGET